MQLRKLIVVCTFTILMMLLISCGAADSPENNDAGDINIQDSESVTDIDGNVYRTITIGSQTWMAENLKTTRFNDGEVIPNVTGNSAWENLNTPGYCWYDNNIQNWDVFGALYNWYAVNTGRLAPTGWHVPTAEEWITLINYLGGEEVAGGKLKETGTEHWLSPNSAATNETTFTALGAGVRDNVFMLMLEDNYIWTASRESDGYGLPLQVHLKFNHGAARLYSMQPYSGFVVRCVKD